MSVLIETSLGSLTVDLYTTECPLASKNFLKLCKLKYYNGCLFFNVQRDFVVQCGDPTGTGKGGNSVYGCVVSQRLGVIEYHGMQ
jgi:peptidyl-prolyl cis-trans isomerase-like 4